MHTMDQISMPSAYMNYSYTFQFEDDFKHWVKKEWMERNWKSWCFYSAGLYMMVIFCGRHYMQNRHRFIEKNKVSGFWTWMFILSKVPELGDTVFIVLRKQPLIFLHWYHHVTVLIYTWYSFSEFAAPGRWFISMNYVVHSLMYTYYTLKAMRYRVPRAVAMIITICQVAQMILGIHVNIFAYNTKMQGEFCQVTEQNIKVSFLMYFSYFVLFTRFFYLAYMKKPGMSPTCSTSSLKDMQRVKAD
ncbi:unnamed protein product [Darwinula stevensoni]|uniref:Elongation of very long chain fatty acids protein n=1 Tax=Darwinula stevensoni TaxID=69355 RepID=A0A7R8X7P7_9CRUS|nr:unnamed protein product [Darwinula stevensoni]CAG0887127.1 unnamed protein product [Darwinula stevensoni]